MQQKNGLAIDNRFRQDRYFWADGKGRQALSVHLVSSQGSNREGIKGKIAAGEYFSGKPIIKTDPDHLSWIGAVLEATSVQSAAHLFRWQSVGPWHDDRLVAPDTRSTPL
jgi:hypothetical protein